MEFEQCFLVIIMKPIFICLFSYHFGLLVGRFDWFHDIDYLSTRSDSINEKNLVYNDSESYI